MPNFESVALPAFGRYPQRLLGGYGLHLWWLHTTTQAVPETLLITQRTLYHFGRDTELLTLIPQLIAEHGNTRYLQTALKSAFEQLLLPRWFVAEVTSVYQLYFHQQYVSIRAESPGIFDSYDSPVTPFIQGESNVVESLMETWLNYLNPDIIQLFVKENNPYVLCPQLFIQRQLVPVSSGWIESVDVENRSKTSLVISGGWGVTASDTQSLDRWKIDIRTNNITLRQIAQKNHQHLPQTDHLETVIVPAPKQNQPSLGDAGLFELATACLKMKRQSLTHWRIFWTATQQRVWLTSAEPLVVPGTEPQPQSRVTSKVADPKLNTAPVLAVGKVLQPGYVTARRQLLPSALKTGEILVVPQLVPSQIKLLPKTGGIICESEIVPSLFLAQIRKFSIPTLIGVSHAAKHLSQVQTITLMSPHQNKQGKVLRTTP